MARSCSVSGSGRTGSGGAGRSCQELLDGVGEAAGAGGRDDLPAGSLVEVVLDDRFELGQHGQLALDQVAAAVPGGGDVDESDDAEYALAVDDALGGGDRVASELDAIVGCMRACGGTHERPLCQVALLPYPV